MQLRHLWALTALFGCSFIIDVEGPGFVDPPPDPDQALDLAVIDMSAPDGPAPDLAVDMTVDMTADMLVDAMPDGPPPVFELQTGLVAPAIVHGANGDVRLSLDAADRFIIETTTGESITVRFDNTLITLMNVPPGGTGSVRPPSSSDSDSTMRLRLGSPRDDANNYAISNGCRHLPCEGAGCELFFSGMLSLPINARCSANNRVHTLAIAYAGDTPQAWKQADNPLPETDDQAVEFGEWRDDFERVDVQALQAGGALVYAAPWNGAAFLAHLSMRPLAARQTFSLPAGYASAVELGLDGINPEGATTQQFFRWWRALPLSQPSIMGADRLLPVPGVTLTAEGDRPSIEWSGTAPAGTLARIDLVWEVDGERYRWLLFDDARQGMVRLPALPDAWARWRPAADAMGRALRVRLLRCANNRTLADHYQNPCPIHGPTARPAQMGEWLSWSLGLL